MPRHNMQTDEIYCGLEWVVTEDGIDSYADGTASEHNRVAGVIRRNVPKPVCNFAVLLNGVLPRDV